HLFPFHPVQGVPPMFKILRDKKGAALLEYALLTAGVALVAAASVSVFGHKTSDMMAATATIMPGAHADDNGPILSAKLIETTDANGFIAVDVAAAAAGGNRLGDNLLGSGNGLDLETLVIEP
ncbi:MAG: pilus assembly protein Flp/PilA, partial [Pseudohongiellaceae bacterium]